MSVTVDRDSIGEGMRRLIVDEAVRVSAFPRNFSRSSGELLVIAMARVGQELKLTPRDLLPLIEDGRVREG